MVSAYGNIGVNVGETSKEIMAQTVCNPETRVIQQVTVEDMVKMEKYFEKWMDTKVEDRKEYIENNLHRYLIDVPIEEVKSQKEITKIIEDNMMEYSADLIFDRALCSIESGLKPSQLRSLWAMYANKVTKFTKSLNVTGFATRYHSHGSIYPTIVNMCQEDRHSQPLITGEGNFGNYTSKQLTAAADRYTNVKLSELALDGLKEVDKNYVEMIPTYDNKGIMPLYLPSKYPVILTQASEGMAVGMASKLPSFNFNEVCEATILYIKTGEQTTLVPDFATYGYIVNNKNTIEAINKNGKGSLKLRGRCELDDNKKVILVKEVPYGTYREDIIDKIVDLVKEGKLKEIISVKDSTDLKGMGIRIECKNNTNLKELEQKLYKLTPLESSYACNMNVLTQGMPKVMGVWGIIPKWIEFRKSCIIRSLRYEKDKLEKDLHLFNGFRNIIEELDRVIEIIRFNDEPINDLQARFGLDEIQAKYVYGLSLRDINKKYIEKKLQDIEVLTDKINELEETIDSNDRLLDIIVSDLEYINKTYKSPRRTQIIEEVNETNDILVEDYNVQFVTTREGYFKKIRLTSLRGKFNHRLKDGDEIVSERNSNNKADLLVFTTKQNCYKIKANDIPDHKASVLGLYLPSHLQLEEDEKVVDVIPTTDYTEQMLVAFNTGRVVRLSLEAYKTKTNRTRVVKALHTDKVVRMCIIEEESNYVLKSANNRALIFNSKDINLKASKSSQGVIVMQHKDIEIVAFKHISEVEIDSIGRYAKGKSGVGILPSDKI